MPAEKTSHISSAGADLSARSTISSFPPLPPVEFSTISESSSNKGSRPRPRPIFGRTGGVPTLNASISDPVLPHVPTDGSDHGDQFAVVAHSDPTAFKETTRENNLDLNNYSPDISERAKMRTRKATKRPSQHGDEAIDITDDDLAITPARKPKERPKPRPVRRATPVENNSDAVTVPVFSSSPILPPSDPFPASTLVNSTPLRPYPPDGIAAPGSPSQGSPIPSRKRKRTGRPLSPIDDLPDRNHPSAVPICVTSPRSDPLPPSKGVFDDVDLDQNLASKKKGDEDRCDATRTPKKLKRSKNTEKNSGSAATSGVVRSRKKPVVEVVIPSPRKRGSKKVKPLESRKDRPLSSPTPTKLKLGLVEDDDAHASPRQASDSDDELILAPKRQPSSKVKKSRKGKQKARDLDSDALSEIDPSSEQVVVGEEEGEEPRNDERHTEGASTRSNGDHKFPSCPAEPGSPTPLLVGLMAFCTILNADSIQEKSKPNVSAQDSPAKPSLARETPGKVRYSLTQFDRKTPMRELIRRATSHPSVPFAAPSSPIASPLAKTSKSALRRIAPLHLTRRTPPPPPPRPPPPKKSKKMLALEEKWELELEDEVEGWWALTDEERQDWRRAKRDKELGCDD